jgi:hypothetical protein
MSHRAFVWFASIAFVCALLVSAEIEVAACAAGANNYSPVAPPNFVFGQASQGGNYYYGVAGTMTTTFPPDPRDAYHPFEHVAMVMGSVDATVRTDTCCWIYTGWYVGNSKSGVNVSSATRFAELANGSVSQTTDTAAPATGTYETRQNGYDSVTGEWLWTAFKYEGGWTAIGSVELTVPNAEQHVFGEATDPEDTVDVNGHPVKGQCKEQSNPSSSNNVQSSLQLAVDNPASWFNWEPPSRFANLIGDNGYRESSTRSYTDQQVGGCNGC